jgi:sigma-B regulation protein RsbU (phosphoserine phosphatase)
MADKISELIQQTAQKARMEKELETAQAVQNRFFPPKSFDGVLRLAGKYVPASECAGDWWHYAQIGDQLIVVVGDVTGHGVSAALVTAAAHSAFSLVIRQLTRKPEQGVPLDTLVSSLNTAVYAAAGGQATMTFVVSIIDLRTGMMTSSNASHPPLYVYRKPAGGGGSPMSHFKPIMDGRIPPLGEVADIDMQSSTFQLQPGDRIFWYTDGIMEQRPSDGQKVNKSTFLKLLASSSDASEDSADRLRDSVMKESLDFFANEAERPDDITLVVATVPATAKFSPLASTPTPAPATGTGFTPIATPVSAAAPAAVAAATPAAEPAAASLDPAIPALEIAPDEAVPSDPSAAQPAIRRVS